MKDDHKMATGNFWRIFLSHVFCMRDSIIAYRTQQNEMFLIHIISMDDDFDVITICSVPELFQSTYSDA